MKKEKSETLLEFASRFEAMANTFSAEQLLPSRVAKIFFQKLPKQLLQQLAILNVENCTLTRLITRIRNYLDWMSISDQSAWQDNIADFMDIDSVLLKSAVIPESSTNKLVEVEATGVQNERVISPGNRINWANVKDPSSLMVAWRCIMRTDSRQRTECLRWLNQRPNGNWNDRRSTLGNRRNFRRNPRINEVETLDEDEALDVFDIPSPMNQNAEDSEDLGQAVVECYAPIGEIQAATTHLEYQTSEEKARRLLHCRISLEGNGTQALVDTGAAVSVVSWRLCQKFGLPIDTSKTELLCGFNQSVTRTKGIINANVKIGDYSFNQEFHVIPLGSQKVIMGNDLLYNQDISIHPRLSCIRLQTGNQIPCHSVQMKTDYGKIQIVRESIAVQPSHREEIHQAGYMLYAANDVEIPAQERRIIYTGVKVKLPEGVIGWITGLVSLSIHHAIDVSTMVIDSSFSGQVSLVVINNSKKPFTIRKGDRLARMTFGSQMEVDVTESAPPHAGPTKKKTKFKPSTDVQRTLSAKAINPMHKQLQLEAKAKFLPRRQDHLIKLPVNRSFYLKPYESRLVYMPIKASHEIVLHPALHPHIKISAGVQPAN